MGLRYESHIHVPFTRAKRKIIFQLNENNDDIHKRFSGCDSVCIRPTISNRVSVSDITDYIDLDSINNIELKYDINNLLIEESNTKVKEIIDFNDHCVRYYVFRCILQLLLVGHCLQSKVIFEKLSKIHIKEYPVDEYLRKLEEFTDKSEGCYFPICKYSGNTYSAHIKNDMKHVQCLLRDTARFEDYTAKDYIILGFMVDIFRHGIYSNIKIHELYSTCHRLSSSKTIQNFYEKVKAIDKIINNMYCNIQKKYKIQTWNIEHYAKYRGGTESIKFQLKNIPVIGYSADDVVNISLKTNCSTINRLECIAEIILQRFILRTPSARNIERYEGKNLISYVLLLETGEFEEINWGWDRDNKEIKQCVYNTFINYYTPQFHELFHYCNKICKNWSIVSNRTSHKNPFNYIIYELSESVNTLSCVPRLIEKIKLLYENKTTNLQARDIINNIDIFLEEIVKLLKEMLDDYISEPENQQEFIF